MVYNIDLLNNIAVDLDYFLLDYAKCSQEERETAVELFNRFIHLTVETTCLNCGEVSHISKSLIHADDKGAFAFCNACDSSFDVPEEVMIEVNKPDPYAEIVNEGDDDEDDE